MKKKRNFLLLILAVLLIGLGAGSTTVSEHLEQIAAQGYGTDDEEYAIGVGCVAVPIHTPDNKIIAAVGTTGPVAPYKTPESFNSILEHLKETAQQIEERMF